MHPDGKKILEEKPRVDNETWNIPRMLELPDHTFGHQYAKWMSKFRFHPEERPVVKYVPDLELAYIIQRYREVLNLF